MPLEAAVSMTKLHLWKFGPDTVVAADEADVRAVMRGIVGEASLNSDYVDDEPDLIDEDHLITIFYEDDGERVTKSAREWADENGRGFLCSTDY
jgi:hypothetical protein